MSDPVTATLVTLSIAGITLVCVLNALSSTLLREIALIDLKRETARLQAEHDRRLAELRRGRLEMAEVELVPGDQAKAA
jgi:hypothetical protein